MKFTGEKACTGSKTLQVPAHSWQQFDFDGEGDLREGFFFASALESGFETATACGLITGMWPSPKHR